MQHSPFSKLMVPQQVKNFPLVYETWRFITVNTTAQQLSLSYAT